MTFRSGNSVQFNLDKFFPYVIAGLLVPIVGPGQQLPDELSQKLASIIRQECLDKQLAAFSIVMTDDKQIIGEYHYGSKQEGKPGDAVNGNTLYRTGSVGKTITDLAILVAMDHGKLDLDADVRTYLHEFHPVNPYNKPVTLKTLMTHQSGLVREPPTGNYFDNTGPTLEETVRSLDETTLLWEPGSKTKYSNAGLAVAGRVLEVVYGMPYARVIDSLVFRPLGMKTARVGFQEPVRKDLAIGYMWFPGKGSWEAPMFDLGMVPAGDLYASTNDMAAFMTGLMDPDRRPIPTELYNRMWRPYSGKTNWQLDVGLGFSLNGKYENDYKLARHGGAVYGYATELMILPEERLGVYAVTTKDVYNGVVQAIANWLLKAVLRYKKGMPLPDYELTSKPFTTLPDRLKGCNQGETVRELLKYTGTYGKLHNPLNICIIEGRLYARIEWFFLYPLTKVDSQTFLFPSYALYGYEKLTFKSDSNHVVREAVIGNGKEGIHFIRNE